MGKRKLTKNKKPKRKCQSPLLAHSINKKKKKICEFERLPNEMIDHILDMLTLLDMKASRRVCSRWNQVLERKVNYNYPLSNSTLPKLRSRKYKINELQVILDELEIPQQFTEDMRGSLLTVNSLKFMASKPWKNSYHIFDGVGVKSFLNVCKSIRTLKFDFTHLELYCMSSSLNLNGFQLPFLQKLQLKLAYGGQTEAIVMSILRLETPCLEALEVERFNLCARGFHSDEIIYLGIQELIVRNKLTLKTLKLVNSLINIITVPPRSIEFPPELLTQLSELKLDTLEIEHMHGRNYDPYDPFGLAVLQQILHEDWTAANQLLRNHTRLKTFKLTTNSTAMVQKSYRILAQSRHTLTNLEIDISKSPTDYDLRFLRFLNCLKHFSLSSTDYEFGQFPESLQDLVWNVPLCFRWYMPENRNYFFNLVTMTVGIIAVSHMNLGSLCRILFTEPMHMKRLTICRHTAPANEDSRETRQMYARRNRCLDQALRLDTEIYNVEYDEKFIHVTLLKPVN